MKNLKKILAMILVAATMSLAACSKDDKEAETPNSLVNTTWEGSEDMEAMGSHIHISMTSKFLTDTTGEMDMTTVINSDTDSDTFPFTYNYDAPNGTLTGTDDEGEVKTFSFKVDGNTMSIFANGVTIKLKQK